MQFVLKDQGFGKDQDRCNLEDMNREQAATVVFALMHYEDSLNKSLAKARKKYNRRKTLSNYDELLEEEMFLLTTLAQIVQVKYAILADHGSEDHDQIREWLNVI